MSGYKRESGFTIVELLIVIVVIAILAAVTIVAYNGVTQNAVRASVQADVSNAAKALETYRFTEDPSERYPLTLDMLAFEATEGNEPHYIYRSSTNEYCLQENQGDVVYHVTNSNSAPTEGACTVTNYSTNPRLAGNSAGYSTQTPSGNTFGRIAGAGPEGQAVYRVTTSNSGQLRIRFATQGHSLVPGEVLTISLMMNSTASGIPSNIECDFDYTWRSFATDPLQAGWHRYTAQIVAPSLAPSINGCQVLTTAGSNVPSGSVFELTDVMITKGTTAWDYADGDSDGWSWSGAPGLSTSSGPAILES